MNNLKTDIVHKVKEEHLARFLNQRSKFSKSEVKHSAFHPPKGTATTSVFRHGNTPPHNELIEIGKHQKMIIKAIASMLERDIISLKLKHPLSVVSDTTRNQHPKHAHIVFPFENNEENFHEIIYICMEIAKCARLIRDEKNNILSVL